ncbi:MAG: hypothetical protein CMP74_02225 [Flavobacteriales bacterium]|nr:hypothetical protein [Flavobacteriales bacterium]|tara:strand:- start:718 stop:1710 length:993 start_codon:yes stop_codon:yes gene_type:complete
MILVTGAAGFIGFHLVKKLVEYNHNVVAVDNINDFYDVNLKKNRLKLLGINADDRSFKNCINENIIFYKIDLLDSISLNKIFTKHKIDLVFHLASHAGVKYSTNIPKTYLNNNIIGFINLIDAVRNFNINKFIYASSSSLYPNNIDISELNENLNLNEFKSIYAASKKTNEIIANTYSKIYDFNSIGLRFFSVYGPMGRPDMSYFIFCDSIFKKKKIKLYNSGEIYRDFTYVDDVVDFLLNLINHKEDSKYAIYNVGNSKPVKILDILNKIEKITGLSAEKIMFKKNKEDNYATCAKLDRIKSEFNYNPKWDIDSGLHSFVSWYKDYYNV